jgi:hypothetical protein
MFKVIWLGGIMVYDPSMVWYGGTTIPYHHTILLRFFVWWEHRVLTHVCEFVGARNTKICGMEEDPTLLWHFFVVTETPRRSLLTVWGVWWYYYLTNHQHPTRSSPFLSLALGINDKYRCHLYCSCSYDRP